jgi:3-dehydroquinate synthase
MIKRDIPRQTVHVSLGERSYQVLVGPGLLASAGRLVREALPGASNQLAIVSNPAVFDRYGRALIRGLRRAGYRAAAFLIGDGERFKTIRTAERVLGFLAENHLERRSALIALGGGVVGDVAGFGAATYMRGIPYVQVPTTLLAAIDSSVGGKTGVNLPHGKNLVGAFHQPALVITDVGVLRSLPPREIKSGLYEAIKYGVIADRDLFEFIRGSTEKLLQLDPEGLTRLIARCCEIKAEVVAEDEREGGRRQVLNFGHTFGHALESLTRYRRLTHGEAVGHGMMMAARLAARLGMMDREPARAIEAVVLSLGRLPRIDDLEPAAVFEAMRHDKKARAGRLTLILPAAIGEVRICRDVAAKAIKQSLRDFFHTSNPRSYSCRSRGDQKP